MRCSIREDGHNLPATTLVRSDAYPLMGGGRFEARPFCTSCAAEEVAFLEEMGFGAAAVKGADLDPRATRRAAFENLPPVQECWSVRDVVRPAEED